MTYITHKLNRYKKEAAVLQVRNRIIIDMKYVKFKLNRYKKEAAVLQVRNSYH